MVLRRKLGRFEEQSNHCQSDASNREVEVKTIRGQKVVDSSRETSSTYHQRQVTRPVKTPPSRGPTAAPTPNLDKQLDPVATTLYYEDIHHANSSSIDRPLL